MMKEKVIKKGFVEKNDIRKDRGIKMIEGGGDRGKDNEKPG